MHVFVYVSLIIIGAVLALQPNFNDIPRDLLDTMTRDLPPRRLFSLAVESPALWDIFRYNDAYFNRIDTTSRCLFGSLADQLPKGIPANVAVKEYTR